MHRHRRPTNLIALSLQPNRPGRPYCSSVPCTYMNMCFHVYVCVHIYIYISLSLPYIYTYMYVYVSICLSTYLSIYLSIYLSMDLSIYRSIYLHIHAYIHTYLHRYMPIHMYVVYIPPIHMYIPVLHVRLNFVNGPVPPCAPRLRSGQGVQLARRPSRQPAAEFLRDPVGRRWQPGGKLLEVKSSKST